MDRVMNTVLCLNGRQRHTREEPGKCVLVINIDQYYQAYNYILPIRLWMSIQIYMKRVYTIFQTPKHLCWPCCWYILCTAFSSSFSCFIYRNLVHFNVSLSDFRNKFRYVPTYITATSWYLEKSVKAFLPILA